MHDHPIQHIRIHAHGGSSMLREEFIAVGNPPEKEVVLKVEFSPTRTEEVLHEEVAFFGKPDHRHSQAS